MDNSEKCYVLIYFYSCFYYYLFLHSHNFGSICNQCDYSLYIFLNKEYILLITALIN